MSEDDDRTRVLAEVRDALLNLHEGILTLTTAWLEAPGYDELDRKVHAVERRQFLRWAPLVVALSVVLAGVLILALSNRTLIESQDCNNRDALQDVLAGLERTGLLAPGEVVVTCPSR